MKEFCVVYEVTTSYDAAVSAKTKDEAIAKVKEVIGSDVVVTGTWEVKRGAR